MASVFEARFTARLETRREAAAIAQRRAATFAGLATRHREELL